MHTCPRRSEIGLPSYIEDKDQYVPQDGTCSFCGSMHPDKFMELAAAGREIIPTDKNYKVYVAEGEVGQMKFYFQHLSEEQKHTFIELYNEKKLNLGYPGCFYVHPYFMSFKPLMKDE